MRKTGLRFILAIALAVGFMQASCATYYSRSLQSINSSYTDYRQNQTRLDHRNIVAMLAYSSARLSNASIRSLDQFKHELLAYIDDVTANGRIDTNYPVKPSRAETAFVRRFMSGMHSNARRRRVGAKTAVREYGMAAGSLISKLHDLEYAGSR